MHKGFYPRLAAQNLRKNSRFYTPYLLTCIFSVAMFYNLCFVTFHKGLDEVGGGGDLRFLLMLGCIIMGIFSVIILFYTNSFLAKHRRKEFGLYNILGMEKSNIAHMLVWETVFSLLISLVGGLALGVLLSKLVLLILFRLLAFSVPLGFSVSGMGMGITAILFTAIFFINLIHNLISIRISKPIELLHGGNVGEKEPRSNWFIAILGVLCLGTGYYLALAVTEPLEALLLFFLAVLLVIIGTYCLFAAGSIALLKLLRRNKRYYYKARHFTTVSGMMYRMKQNAAGLASICILSTMVLVMISTTVCMYRGTEHAISSRYPTNFSLTIPLVEREPERPALLKNAFSDVAAQKNLTMQNETDYSFLSFAAVRKDNVFTLDKPNDYNSSNVSQLCIVTADQYKAMTGREVTLAEDEVLLACNRRSFDWNTVNLGGTEFRVLSWMDYFPISGEYAAYTVSTYAFVVSDEAVLTALDELQKNAYGESASQQQWYIAFDLDADDDKIVACLPEMISAAAAASPAYNVQGEDISLDYYTQHLDCREKYADQFYALYGGLLFVGLFLGVLFLGATVLIIYYKQVSEGYDDKSRFEIMQKVGMSRAEVRRSIQSQIMTVFYLPLVVAVIHLAFAYNMIVKLMSLLNLTDLSLFFLCLICTVVIFAIVYTVVYLLTSRTYYSIVSPTARQKES